MVKYYMKNKEMIEAESFKELRKIVLGNIKASDSYLRSLIKGVA